MTQIRKTYDKVKTDLLVDLAIFMAFLIAMDPHSTGIAIHEWLSIAFGAAVLVHLLLHWSWIVGVTRRFFSRISRQARTNYILNLALFIDMTVIIFTGLMISESALPALGIQVTPGFLWRRLHSASADFSLFLLGLHVALHWRWIVATCKRYLLAPFMPRKLAGSQLPAAQLASTKEEVQS